MHTNASDPENTTYMFYLPNDTIEKTNNFLNKVTDEWKKDCPSFHEFAIVYDNIQFGAISIYLNGERKTGELSWIINKKYWKQGIAFESTLAIKEFATNVLKANKIIVNCDYRNTSSFNLMKKTGMALESDKGTRTYPQNNETVQEITCSLEI